MKTKLLTYLVLTLFVFINVSCSSDDNSESDAMKAAKEDCELAISNAVAQGGGVVCCVLGNFKAAPGATLVYEYNTNITDAVYSWSVASGEITIVSGQDSKQVTILLSQQFTGGELVCFGKNSDGNACSDIIYIEKK